MKSPLVNIIRNLRSTPYKRFIRNAPYYPISGVGYNRGFSYEVHEMSTILNHSN